MKIAIFASGNGSNFEAIAQAVEKQDIQAEIAVLFCDQKSAFVLERAAKYQVPTVSFSPKDFSSKVDYENEIKRMMHEFDVELIVLAGYMRIVGLTLLEAFPKKIINLHPSLLPSFPGLHGIQDAFDYGVKVSGITIHYIDEGVDTGPIIAQVPTEITAEDTLESLEEKIHQLEHYWYPKVLGEIIQKESYSYVKKSVN
ncbi:MAG TPA: phosphoribosylglycinamide formyltransferase [Candidatus Enterococcus avicola]|uniref:Phosphoribosylglycinamide formyltransferase n=1 Tax=Candidatus Enterococcus avicola TaxID=2838561 RepID=A0A9D2F7P8_9ENTE|nr:phosphoribosylglycinamide formyltransferase [Candidatus Enterococcus avicola]